MKLLYTVILVFCVQLGFSQTATLKGVTVDESLGKPLPLVSILIKGTKHSVLSDMDGKFLIKNIKPGKYDIEFTAISFKTKMVSDVEFKEGEEVDLTISLEENINQLEEVVVVTSSKMKAESLKSLLTMQKNSASVSDGISAEVIKKTPDRNTSDVIKRISGASIQDNRFVVVRGLNDRYNAAFLNGSPLPSSEPDRKAFSFDIFPSNMIDNLVISKTASPDLPGEFAGGVIQITTKGIPDKNFQSLSVSGGYNTITTGKNQLYYEGGKNDWLGVDDGTRALPSNMPDNFTFSELNAEQRAEYAKSFSGDWGLYQKKFSPNVNFQYSLGRSIKIKDKTLGVMVSTSYNKSNSFNETTRRDYEEQGEGLRPMLNTDYLDKNYAEQYLLGGLANFSLKLNANNTISFKNIYSINSDDRVIQRKGAPQEANIDNPLKVSSTVRWFTSNKIYSGQLNGDHNFSKSKFRVNWLASLSKVSRSIPNLRRNVYTGYDKYQDPLNPNPVDLQYTANIPDGNGGPDYGGGMFFSENNENVQNARLDLTKKLGSKNLHELKVGFFAQNRKRDFFARQLQFNMLNTGDISFNPDLLLLDDSKIFNAQNMGQTAPGVGGFTLYDASKYFDKYDASSSLAAGYLMLDNKIGFFRAVYGFRMESYHQKLTTKLSPTEDLNVDNKQNDFLPSVNLIFSLNQKQNLRFSFSKTLNRPEFRELAPFGFYDFTTQFFTSGNPDLQIARINNFDFRYEIYPGKSQIFSVSFFHKKFSNPIEMIAGVNNKEVVYKNALSATNYGFELEFRTLLASVFGNEDSLFLNNLTLFSNVAIINSKVDVSNIAASSDTQKSRPMQGQSPYVFNAGIQFLTSESGWSVSTNINTIGDRIAVVGNSETEPNLWEKGRTFLDAQIAKSFLKKKLELKFNAQNILAQDLVFYWNRDLGEAGDSGLKGTFDAVFNGDKQNKNGYNANEDDLIWLTKFGRTFSLALTFNF